MAPSVAIPMQIRHPVKHFPELGAVPASEHTQIVELARYEVFVTNKTAGRRMLSFMLTLALAFLIAAGFLVALPAYMDPAPFWLIGVLGGALGGGMSWVQHRRYVRLLQPAVARLCHARTI